MPGPDGPSTSFLKDDGVVIPSELTNPLRSIWAGAQCSGTNVNPWLYRFTRELIGCPMKLTEKFYLQVSHPHKSRWLVIAQKDADVRCKSISDLVWDALVLSLVCGIPQKQSPSLDPRSPTPLIWKRHSTQPIVQFDFGASHYRTPQSNLLYTSNVWNRTAEAEFALAAISQMSSSQR